MFDAVERYSSKKLKIYSTRITDRCVLGVTEVLPTDYDFGYFVYVWAYCNGVESYKRYVLNPKKVKHSLFGYKVIFIDSNENIAGISNGNKGITIIAGEKPIGYIWDYKSMKIKKIEDLN